MMTPHGFHAPRRQRGVIGLLGAIVMLLVAVCIALALDTGRLYMEKRNLQRVADLAALSVASRCETLSSCDQAVTYAQDVLEDNGYARELLDVEGESKGITLGRVMLEDVVDGDGSAAYRRYEFDPSLAQDAVRVELENSVSPPLMANFMPDDDSDGATSDDAETTLQATAVARKTNYVAFSVGSRLASLDSSESPLLAPLLGGLLGSKVPLSLVGYEGVLDTQVTLLELASEMPGLGVDLAALTVNEVLNSSITMQGLVQASAKILTDQGVADLRLINVMNERLSNSTFLPDRLDGEGLDGKDIGDVELQISELLDIQVADGENNSEALKTGIRLGDLLGTSLLLANRNRENAISLENLTVDVPGVTADVSLSVIEAPQLAVGAVGCIDGEVCDGSNWITTAKTAQLDLDAVFDINLLNVLELNLTLEDIAAAQSKAGVESISAGDAGYEIGIGAVTQPLTAKIGVGLEVLSALIKAEIENASPESLSEGASDYMTEDIHDWPGNDSVVVASGVSGLATAVHNLLESLKLNISLLGIIDLGVSTSDLNNALANVITPLVDDVVGPLLSATGLGIGEAEVRVIEVSSSGVELIQ